MLLGLDIKTWLGLGVLAAIVSTVGTLFAVVLKDFFFTRSFERWKQRQTLEGVYQRFRDPLVLAARELAWRTHEILDEYPTLYLRSEVMASRPIMQIENSSKDPYFQRYKLVSTIYRFSAFLGWLELYRQEITFLHSANNKDAKALDIVVSRIRSDLADGEINSAEDWHEWRDALVFREELRAIGESVIESRGSTRAVMGYAHYCEQLESETRNAVQRWSAVVCNFFLDLGTDGKDFRRVRLQRMLIHLVELIQLLEPSSVESRLQQAVATLHREATGK